MLVCDAGATISVPRFISSLFFTLVTCSTTQSCSCWLCSSSPLATWVSMLFFAMPWCSRSLVIWGTSFAHLFSGVFCDMVMPSDGANNVTDPASDCLTPSPESDEEGCGVEHAASVSSSAMLDTAAVIRAKRGVRTMDFQSFRNNGPCPIVVDEAVFRRISVRATVRMATCKRKRPSHPS